jgi:hypothetical protein
MKNKPLGILLVLAGLVAFGASALHAAPPALPPRPTIEPIAEPTAAPLPPGPKLVGGWIQVRVANGSGQWTVVQWQDSAGNWNNVEGWRGAFDTVVNGVGTKTWWIEQPLFGAPNFRWVVYEPGSGEVLGQSQPFSMPQENRQTVTVEISIAP